MIAGSYTTFKFQINDGRFCKGLPGITHFNSFDVCRCCIPIGQLI